MFYVLIFGILAVVLVVVALAGLTRRRSRYAERDEVPKTHSGAKRRTEKARRAQSRHDRRKRH